MTACVKNGKPLQASYSYFGGNNPCALSRRRSVHSGTSNLAAIDLALPSRFWYAAIAALIITSVQLAFADRVDQRMRRRTDVARCMRRLSN